LSCGTTELSGWPADTTTTHDHGVDFPLILAGNLGRDRWANVEDAVRGELHPSGLI
jgi:hypothetical protein